MKCRVVLLAVVSGLLTACAGKGVPANMQRYTRTCISQQAKIDWQRCDATFAACTPKDHIVLASYYACAADTCSDEARSHAQFFSCAKGLDDLSKTCRGSLTQATFDAAVVHQLADFAWSMTEPAGSVR